MSSRALLWGRIGYVFGCARIGPRLFVPFCPRHATKAVSRSSSGLIFSYFGGFLDASGIIWPRLWSFPEVSSGVSLATFLGVPTLSRQPQLVLCHSTLFYGKHIWLYVGCPLHMSCKCASSNILFYALHNICAHHTLGVMCLVECVGCEVHRQTHHVSAQK